MHSVGHQSRILAVIVLYRQRASESRAVCSLQQALLEQPDLVPALRLCVYDNTPDPEPLPQDLFGGLRWHRFQPGRNLGLSRAYNQALEVALRHGVPWLMLLDADTCVTAPYLAAALETAARHEHAGQIGAIVPHITEGALLHSPRIASAGIRHALPLSFSGVSDYEVIAMNSGSVVRTRAIERLGGFSDEFWLDYLDYWLFRVLQRNGYLVWVLDKSLEHSLSFADPSARMPLERYANMLQAELYFTRTYGTSREKLRLPLVLAKRAVKVGFSEDGLPYAVLTLKGLLRLFGPVTYPQLPTR